MSAVDVTFEQVHAAGFSDAGAQRFPYVFLPSYLEVLQRQTGQRPLYAVSSHGEVRLPLLVKTVRGAFRLGQLLSPPLRGGKAISPEEECPFLEALMRALRRERICHRLIQPTTNCVFQAAPSCARGCRFGSYRLRLSDRTEQDILHGMHRDHRYEIRAAMRQGAEVRFGAEHLRAFLDLHGATMRRSSMPHDRFEWFDEMYSVLSAIDAVCCAVVYKGGEPMGGALVPFTRHSGCYSWGGSAADVEPLGAIKLLHWEVIRRLCQGGVEAYDFVGARLSDVRGAKLEFIQRFKSRFGGELVQGWLWKADIVPLVTRVFDTAVAIRRMSSRHRRPTSGDIIEQELKKEDNRCTSKME